MRVDLSCDDMFLPQESAHNWAELSVVDSVGLSVVDLVVVSVAGSVVRTAAESVVVWVVQWGFGPRHIL